jgi:outer membrane lipoprotein-sorting protein
VKTKLRYRWIGLLLVPLGVLAVWGIRTASNARQAEAIVRRALDAEKRIGYVSLQVSRFRVGERLVESQALVARRPPNMRRIHYITPPRLSGVTLWQNAGRTYRYEPKGQELEIYDRNQHRRAVDGTEEALVLRNFQPRLEGEERIAGRLAYRIRLVPRHRGDAWKRLWIDRQSFLRLGTEVYDGNDRLVRATRFQEVDIEPHDTLDPDMFRPTPYVLSVTRHTYSDEEQGKSVEQVSRAVGFPIRLPRVVPQGYVFDGAYTYPCECGCEKPAAQVRWSNGLNTISMFQCGPPCGTGAACLATASGRPASVRMVIGSQSVLFVGETERANLTKMAQSLKSAAVRKP